MNPARPAKLTRIVTLLALAACRGPETPLADVPAVCDLEDALAGNSSRATAATLPTDFTVDGTDTFEGYLCSGDEDWVALDMFAGQMLEIGLSLQNSTGNLEIDLLSAEGALLAQSTSTTNHEALSYVFTSDQRVYLRVYGSTNQTAGGYTVDLAWAGGPCARDALEPNDAGTNPYPLEPGAYPGLTVCYGEDDWYEIPVVDGQVVSMDLAFDAESSDLRARLWRRDSTGALAWVGGSGTTPTGAGLVARVSGPGPYLAQVIRGPDTTNAAYDLTLGIAGAACEPDPFEPNDTYFGATPISGSTLFEGGTVCLGDQDWYKVHLNNGELLSLDLLFSQANGDLALYVYELLADGTLSLRASANSVTDDESILYRPNYTGDYLVYVFPTRGAALGQYDLDVQVLGSSCVVDGYEPNNSPLDASPIADGAYSDMTLCVGDDDWYSFSAMNGQLIDAGIQFSGTGNDLALNLYRLNPDGTLSHRTGSDTLTPNESFVYQPFEDGDFLLRVSRSRGTTLATYSMDFAVVGEACIPDAYEPNNAAPEAKSIANGVYPGQTLCVGDADWYKVEAKNGQMIHVNIGFTHANNDLGLALYKLNDDGSLSSRAGSNGLSDGEELYYRPYDEGTFVVYVYSTRGTTRGLYDLDISVNGQPCVADSFEPNNASFEAAPMTPGTYDQTLCVGDADWYAVDVQNGQMLYAKASNITPGQDVGLAVYKQEADGTVRGRTSTDLVGDVDETLYYQPYDSGTFLLYAYNTRGTAVSSYKLDMDVRGSACSADVYEPNDTWNQAAPLVDGAYPDLHLCVGDGDWYSMEVGNGQLLDIQLAFTHAQNDLGMTLYVENPYGAGLMALVGADSLTDNEWIQYTPYRAGTYYLYVHRSRGTTTATYELDIKTLYSACTPDTFEPNDHWLQAIDFTPQLNTGVPVSLTLCTADIDYFDLGMANAGQTVDVQAQFTHANNHNVDLYLYRLNDDGTLTTLRSAASVTDNERTTYTIPSTWPATHVIARTNVAGGTVTASYQLQADITP